MGDQKEQTKYEYAKDLLKRWEKAGEEMIERGEFPGKIIPTFFWMIVEDEQKELQSKKQA